MRSAEASADVATRPLARDRLAVSVVLLIPLGAKTG